jgi:hypothetical protein
MIQSFRPPWPKRELQQNLDLLAGYIKLLMQLAETEASGRRMNLIIRLALPGGSWERNRDRTLHPGQLQVPAVLLF